MMISFLHRIMFKGLIIFCLVLTVFFFTECFAQEYKKSTGSSSIGALGSGDKYSGYSKSLSESQKRQIVERLDSDDLFDLFDRMDDEDKQDLFSQLSATQKQKLFQQLSDIEKQKIFQTLDDDARIDLFNQINDDDRMVILSNLGRIEKSRLVNSLSPSEKKGWLDKYPELISEIDIQDEDIIEEGGEKGEDLSRLEKIFAGQISSDVDKELHQFGYDFFSQKSTFMPERNVPVGPEYTIGPDDSFTIHLWGKVEDTHFVTVKRDGTITLERLGTLSVGGLTKSELEKFLYNKFQSNVLRVAKKDFKTYDLQNEHDLFEHALSKQAIQNY